jgi:hypothetical protein
VLLLFFKERNHVLIDQLYCFSEEKISRESNSICSFIFERRAQKLDFSSSVLPSPANALSEKRIGLQQQLVAAAEAISGKALCKENRRERQLMQNPPERKKENFPLLCQVRKVSNFSRFPQKRETRTCIGLKTRGVER